MTKLILLLLILPQLELSEPLLDYETYSESEKKEMKPTSNREKTQFFLYNLLRGLFFLVVTIAGYFVAKKYLGLDLKEMMGPLYESPKTVFSMFWISEVVFGIIPPEFFMIWSQRHEDYNLFVSNVIAFMVISYVAGVIGYWFGAYLNTTKAYGFLKKGVFGKFESQFNKYGGFLVIVAAMTPIPFSGVCMLVGSARYSFSRFLFFALTRFVRFTAYAYVIWQVHVA